MIGQRKDEKKKLAKNKEQTMEKKSFHTYASFIVVHDSQVCLLPRQFHHHTSWPQQV